MARGAQKTAEDMAKGGYNSAQQFNQNLTAQNRALEGVIIPGYENMLKNPAAEPNVQAAATSFAAGQDALARRAARTGNSAGMVAGEDKLAQEKAITEAGLIEQNKTDALKGLSGMYGMDTNLLARSLGIPPEYLNSYINAGQMKKGGFTGAFSTALGSGLGNALTAPIGG